MLYASVLEGLAAGFLYSIGPFSSIDAEGRHAAI